MAEIVITKDNFEAEVLKSEIPVILDFWATWCGPCRMIAPALAEIAGENEGRIKVGKINVDEEMELAVRFGITAIPTLIVFSGGTQTNQAMGYLSKDQILALV